MESTPSPSHSAVRDLLEIVARAADAAVLVDASERIVDVVATLTRSSDLVSEASIGQRLEDVLGPGWVDRATTHHPDGSRPVEVRVGVTDGGGQYRELQISIAGVPAGAPGWRILALRDLHDHRIRAGQLAHQAMHDQLTGLVNRAAFLERVDHEMRRGGLLAAPVAVMFIDLDRFKPVNDRFGHAMGDAILARVAERLSRVAEPGDTVARLGGDEFALLLGTTDAPAIGAVVDRGIDLAQRILDAMGEPVTVGDVRTTISASIGLAVGDAASSTQSLLHDADLAMYEAKRAGAGRIKVFDPTMRNRAGRLVEYRRELPTAIARDHLRVVYLPQVELATGRIEGWEALVRWAHPVLGTVEPEEFISIAERAGVMGEIGAWARRRALQAVRAESSARFLSLNLGQSELGDPAGARAVLDDLAAAGVAPERVILEVPERLMDLGSAHTRAALAELRAARVRIALDDLSAEGASMDLLHRAPVDLIKLSPPVVATATEGAGSLAALFLEVARRRGLWVVAEGVETDAQREALIRLGCPSGQGRAISTPVPDLGPIR